MARCCELTGKKPMAGKNVSHAQNKTLRRFLPNLRRVSLTSEALGSPVKLKISAHALRSVEYAGGIDAFLAKASATGLSPKARRYQKRILDAVNAP